MVPVIVSWVLAAAPMVLLDCRMTLPGKALLSPVPLNDRPVAADAAAVQSDDGVGGHGEVGADRGLAGDHRIAVQFESGIRIDEGPEPAGRRLAGAGHQRRIGENIARDDERLSHAAEVVNRINVVSPAVAGGLFGDFGGGGALRHGGADQALQGVGHRPLEADRENGVGRIGADSHIAGADRPKRLQRALDGGGVGGGVAGVADRRRAEGQGHVGRAGSPLVGQAQRHRGAGDGQHGGSRLDAGAAYQHARRQHAGRVRHGSDAGAVVGGSARESESEAQAELRLCRRRIDGCAVEGEAPVPAVMPVPVFKVICVALLTDKI